MAIESICVALDVAHPCVLALAKQRIIDAKRAQIPLRKWAHPSIIYTLIVFCLFVCLFIYYIYSFICVFMCVCGSQKLGRRSPPRGESE